MMWRRPEKRAPTVELTHNWDPEDYQGGRNFGHLAYQVDDIYETCAGVFKTAASRSTDRRAMGTWPLSGRRTGFRSNCCRRVRALPAAEPWASMPNVGVW